MVYAAVAHDLKIPSLMRTYRFRVFKAIQHADTFDRRLDRAVYAGRFRQVGRFEHSGSNVDDVMPLSAHLVDSSYVLGPGDDYRVSGAAVVGGNLFGPHERRITGDGPSSGHVRIRGRTAPLVVMLELF